MSEQSEPSPLTRRERRLQEAAAAGLPVDGGDEQSQAESTSPVGEGDAATSSDSVPEIEVSAVNEDGSPRSRREIREIRERLIAERQAELAETEAAAQQTDVSVDAEPDTAVVDESEDESAQPELPDDSSAAEDDTAVAGEPEPSEEPASSEELASSGDSGPDEEARSADVPEDLAGDSKDVSETDKAMPAPVSAFTPPSVSGDSEADSGSASDGAVGPSTQPFSVADLEEAERANAGEVPAAVEEPVEAAHEVSPKKSRIRLPWQRGSKSQSAEPAVEVPESVDGDSPETDSVEESPEAEADETAQATANEASLSVGADAAEADLGEAATTDQDSSDVDATETPEAEAAETASGAAPEAEADDEEPAADSPDVRPEVSVETTVLDAHDEVEGEASEEGPADTPSAAEETEVSGEDGSQPTNKYSFPDIVPPEEWRSVFDDPTTRVVPSAPASGGIDTGEGFDDLISRAVVQEGTTGGTGTSALILPSMPDDAGLAGPLGGTGELYVTGSIELPKSLGETGGHAFLHDSVEVDPMDDLVAPPPVMNDRNSGPVSARSAVSARSHTGVPAMSEVKQDRSKLPLVLSLTGGGLILGVGALVIWGAGNGMFG